MERLSSIIEVVEKNLLTNPFIKRFLDTNTDSEYKIIYKNYLNRIIKYLIFNDEVINNIDEVIELFLKRNVKIITILDIFHIIKKEIFEVLKAENLSIDTLYEEMEAKQNFFIHQYVECYFKKFSNMQLLLEELEMKEYEFEKQSKIFEEYKKAVDHSSIVSKTDITGKITYVNDKFCEISGYTKEELLGESHSIIRHQDMTKEIYQDLWDTIQSGNIWQGKLKNKKKDENYYIVDATVMPITDFSGKIVEYIAIRKDITDLENNKIEMDKLKASEMRDNVNKAISISNQEMINNIPLASLYLNIDDIIISYNEKFVEIFNLIDDNDIVTKLEQNKATIYDICEGLDLLVWRYEIDTVDNKLQIQVKNSEKSTMTISVKEIDDKLLVIFY